MAGLPIQEITREQIAQAIRKLRASRKLTQREVAIRARKLKVRDFGSLLESQISDFERGKVLPSFGSLLMILAACSADGKTIDFRLLQDALEGTGGVETHARVIVTHTVAIDTDQSDARHQVDLIDSAVKILQPSNDEPAAVDQLRVLETATQRLLQEAVDLASKDRS